METIEDLEQKILELVQEHNAQLTIYLEKLIDARNKDRIDRVKQDIKVDEVFQAAAKSAEESYDPEKTMKASELGLRGEMMAYDMDGNLRNPYDIHNENAKRDREILRERLREKGIIL